MIGRSSFAIIMIVVVMLTGCGGIELSDTTSPTPESTEKTSESVPSPTPESTDRTSEHVSPFPTEDDTPKSENCTITGTDGDDEIHGTSGDDIICGFNGSDDIYGGGGDDVIYGDSDMNDISGNRDIDEIYGQEGNDVIYGSERRFTSKNIFAGDEIHGGPGDDKILGGPGTNHLYGEEGNDMIAAGSDRVGDDIEGGPGDDVLYPGLGTITVGTTGGNGSDVAVMLDGSVDSWAAGPEPSSVPVPVTVIKKLPVSFSVPLDPTNASAMVSVSVLKGYLNIGTGGDVCICDPLDSTL